MTKKHFEALAASLKATSPGVTQVDYLIRLQQWHEVVLAVASFCASQNANFNRYRFLTACGMGE